MAEGCARGSRQEIGVGRPSEAAVSAIAVPHRAAMAYKQCGAFIYTLQTHFLGGAWRSLVLELLSATTALPRPRYGPGVQPENIGCGGPGADAGRGRERRRRPGGRSGVLLLQRAGVPRAPAPHGPCPCGMPAAHMHARLPPQTPTAGSCRQGRRCCRRRRRQRERRPCRPAAEAVPHK